MYQEAVSLLEYCNCRKEIFAFSDAESGGVTGNCAVDTLGNLYQTPQLVSELHQIFRVSA